MQSLKTIEPFEDGFAVYEHGEYEESSVLAGQSRRTFLESYASLDEASVAHPDAEILDHSTRPFTSRVSDVPFDDFDPADAGERWDDNY